MIGQPREAERTARTPVNTAVAMKRSRITASCRGLAVERISVIRRIGPNSPIAPPASR